MNTVLLVLALVAVLLVMGWMLAEMFSLSLTGVWLSLSGAWGAMCGALGEIVADLFGKD